MNKTETRKAINKALFEHIEEKYKDILTEADDDYGLKTYMMTDGSYDRISYHRSEHYFCESTPCSQKCKDVMKELESFMID